MSDICNLKRYYDEPKEDYNCFSTSLFFKDNYFKMKKNFSFKDETMLKVKSFITNITKTLSLFLENKVPKNYYYRLYYDKSLTKIEAYKNLINILKKIEKVQLIEYECNNFKNMNNQTGLSHIDLFGTFMRFHALFDDKSPNLKTVIMVDADNEYKPKFIDIIENFIKSKNIVSCILPISVAGMHNNDFQELNYFNFIYMMAGGVFFKKSSGLFTNEIWDKYFNNMFKQYDLMYLYNYIDFKRFSINSVLNIKTPELKSYYGFHYGTDEIWLNYVIKKILKDNNKEDLLQPYITKNYNINFVVKRFLTFLEYNEKTNNKNFKLFIKNSKFKSLKDLKKYTKNKKLNYHKFFDEIKKNKYLDRIYIQNSIKYIILNYKFLQDKTKGQLFQNEIM